MAYQIEGVPVWAYVVARRPLHTPFAEWPSGWNPWEREEDALELVEALKTLGVPVEIRTWSGKTVFSDLCVAVQDAIQRNRMPRSHRRRGQLCGVSIGSTGRWAIATTLSEAICRAYTFYQKSGELGKKW
jgi:hypothetical protein